MKREIPNKISFLEIVQGIIYGTIIVIAWIILILSTIFILIYFFSFIIYKDFFNGDFIQLCIYLIIGTFLIIFVYDEHCKRKIFVKQKNKL